VTRTPAAGRSEYGHEHPTRDYPVTGPWTQHQVIDWLLEKCPDWGRARAVQATAIAVAMRSNTEPVPGGMVTIRVIPGGLELEERTGRG
jgi:hypothetical protein